MGSRSRVEDALKRHNAGEPVSQNVAALSQYVQTIDTVPMLPIGADAAVLDLEVGSSLLGKPVSTLPLEQFSQLIERRIAASGSDFALGRWGERREIYRSDRYPNRKMAVGYEKGGMAAYGEGQLKDGDIAALIAYMKTLTTDYKDDALQAFPEGYDGEVPLDEFQPEAAPTTPEAEASAPETTPETAPEAATP